MKEEYCDRCAKYGVTSHMVKKELEPLEVKRKLANSKAFLPSLYGFVYTWYNYYECPICHWFKFKQKET